jgi:hypothetical protein
LSVAAPSAADPPWERISAKVWIRIPVATGSIVAAYVAAGPLPSLLTAVVAVVALSPEVIRAGSNAADRSRLVGMIGTADRDRLERAFDSVDRPHWSSWSQRRTGKATASATRPAGRLPDLAPPEQAAEPEEPVPVVAAEAGVRTHVNAGYQPNAW